MFKSFNLWLEEKNYTRQVGHMLLSRLGLDKNALKQDPIKLKLLDKNKVKDAIETIPGLDDDKIAELQTWINHSDEVTLHDLISQLGDEIQIPDTGDELPGLPANLPQGSQKPPKPQPQPAQPQQMPPQQPMM